ncbi:MAG: hypothetical protein ABI977_16380 [Acidobacteriota bacterium]
MTQEQMERAINFLFEHQAQFATDIQMLKEMQAANEQRMQQLAETQAASAAVTEQRMQQLIEVQAGHEKRLAHSELRSNEMSEAIVALTALMGRFTKAQERHDENQAEAEERWRSSLAEADEQWKAKSAETDARLKAFILVVERYINSRNGKGES